MTTATSPAPDEPRDLTRPHVTHVVNYLTIFLILLTLTIVTVCVSFLDVQSETVKVLAALLIACVKAWFVLTYFMHLKFEGRLIYYITAVPCILCIALLCTLIPEVMLSAAKFANSMSLHPFNDVVGMFQRVLIR